MRRFSALLMVAFLPAAASAQAAWQSNGTLSTALQRVENNANSSKFSEYRDLRGDAIPLAFKLNALHSSGFTLEAMGSDLTRDDRTVALSLGAPGRWRIDALWDELPHNFSNQAASPYTTTVNGSTARLDVGQTMSIPFKKLATGAADAANVQRSDSVAAAYAAANARPVDLENLTRTGAVQLRFSGVRALDVTVGYRRREKTGSELSYGPIGDRPPRTLNIQMAEPLDHATGDFTAAADYVRQRYQLRAEYLVSQFENAIDVLEWRNVWASPTVAGAAYDTWDRAVATYGRRPLAPDNQYHLATLTGAVSLPFDSRLTATLARGRMEQDAELVPYAYQNDLLVNKTLPRGTAQAEMNTTQLAAEYFIAPFRSVNVRAFYRSYDLENETPSAQWQYVTQDASNLNGTVAYVNKRQNEPISWARENLGVETTLRLGVLGSSLVLGVEREQLDREHRQAEEVTENILKASWRARPASWLQLRTSYQKGTRDGGEYNWRSPSESYWYTPTDNPDNNDPKTSFEDHPDMRKFDMADRARDRYDVTVTLTPTANLTLSGGYRARKDDFDSDVNAIQPLRGLPLADSLALTPGDQLGLLASESRQLSFDVMYAPVERLSLNASYGVDVGESDMRSIEFNENNKKNPSAVNTAVLGPWTRKSSQWTADFEDRTRYAAVGAAFEVIPGKVTADASYTMSLSELDIGYGGFGLLSFDGTVLPTTHEFAFQPPPTVDQKSHMANLAIEFPILRNMGGQLGWQYESFTIQDWQQGTATTEFEALGSEYFLRDSSRSHQWGNRLYNMGAYLAPGFTGHALYFGLNYRFGHGGPAM